MQVHLLPVWTWCIPVHLLACAWCVWVYLAYVCMVCAGTLECVCMCTGDCQTWQWVPCTILLWSPPLLVVVVAIVSLLQSLTEPRDFCFNVADWPGSSRGPPASNSPPTPSPRTTDASKQAHCLMWLPENSNSTVMFMKHQALCLLSCIPSPSLCSSYLSLSKEKGL